MITIALMVILVALVILLTISVCSGLQNQIGLELDYGEKLVARRRAIIAERDATARERELHSLRQQIADLTESRQDLFNYLLRIENPSGESS